jgi:large subunit ribosomal protein L19
LAVAQEPLNKPTTSNHNYFFEDEKTMDLVKKLEAEDRGFPELYPGDEVRVHLRIVEGTRERVQVFPGTIIRLRKGGNNKNFTVRRIASHGIGVERTFLYKSPRIEKIEVLRHSKVRRAQLYYMRERRGKSARLKEARTVNRNK